MSSPPAPEPKPPSRWPRRIGVALVLGGLMFLSGWLHPLTRHRLLLFLTRCERSLTEGETAPPEGGTAPPNQWAHAAWISTSIVPNSERSARAICARFKGVEVDVSFSRDLVPYLSHDSDFERVTGKPGDRLSLRTSAELDALRDPHGDPPLRLEELLPIAEACELVIDVKTDHERAAAKARALAKALGARRERVWVLSMSGPFLSALDREAPGLLLGCEGYLSYGNWLAGFDVASFGLEVLTRERDADARSLGLKRLYWTGRNPEEHALLERWAPDALLFDAPRVPAPPTSLREQP